MLKDAGFSDVIAEDRSHQVIITSVRYDLIFIHQCDLSCAICLFTVHERTSEGVRSRGEGKRCIYQRLLWSMPTHPSAICILIFHGTNCIYSSYDECVQEDYNEIVEGWKAKLGRCSSGEQRWGLFIAKKWCWTLHNIWPISICFLLRSMCVQDDEPSCFFNNLGECLVV